MTEDEIRRVREVCARHVLGFASLDETKRLATLVFGLLDEVERLTALAKASHETSVKAGVIIGERDQLRSQLTETKTSLHGMLMQSCSWHPVVQAAKAWRASFPTPPTYDALIPEVATVFLAVDALLAIEEEERKHLRG